jgi:hypothetical protein
MRTASLSWMSLAAAATLAACALSTVGDGPASLSGGGSDGAVGQQDAPGGDAQGPVDALPPSDVEGRDVPSDARIQADAPLPPPDAPAADGWTCSPVDGGILGTLDLSTFILAGTAVWNENADGRITLTNSNHDEAGAAWYQSEMPPVSGYDLTWSFRVGPGNTAGAGITFAVLQTNAMPNNRYVGSKGSGLGLQGLSGSGYAVAIAMFNTNQIRLVTMPSYTTLESKGNSDTLNDGKIHAVDVSWRAPSTLTATLHSTSGDLTVTSNDAGLATKGSAWFGFTGATGMISDSHNEIASIVVKSLCQ